MKIYINENKLNLLKESEDEVTYYSFFTNIKNFIQELLNDPVNAKPNEFFKKHGYGKSELVKKLLDRGILTKKEDIKEVPNNMTEGESGESKYMIQYKVPKKNFERNVHRLYSRLFENNHKNVFGNQNQIINNILDMDYDKAYTDRGGFKLDDGNEVVMEDGDAGAAFDGATNANISAAAMFDVPMGGVQRKDFYGDTLKRNKDEKNKSISMNRK